MKKASEVLGVDRVRIIQLPKPPGEKKVDISDYFVKHKNTRADFMELVKNSKSVAVDKELIKHISEYNEELRKRLLEGEYTGIGTGYENFDKVIGGLRKGRVVVWS